MKRSQTGEPDRRGGTGNGEGSTVATRIQEWVLVDGNRVVIATILTGGIFILLIVLGEAGLVAFANDDSITRMAGGMIAGTFSLITLVVSINQLILSREFTAAGESRERLGEVLAFRDDLATYTDLATSPGSPSQMLEVLARGIRERSNALGAAGGNGHDANERLDEYARAVTENTEALIEELEQSEFGTFQALSAIIGYDDTWHLYVGRHLRERHGDEIPSRSAAALDELVEGLKLFAVAREHLKTTYLQREVTRFSQLTILVGIPSVVAAIVLGLLYADIAGATIDERYLPPVTSALIAIVVAPLTLLASYILRTATVTRRTASIGPILPHKEPGAGPIDVPEDGDSATRGS